MTRSRTIALCAALLGCGGTTTTPGGAGGAPIALEQLYPSLTAAACESLFRCGATGDNATTRLLLGDVQRCATTTQRLGSADIDDITRAVREGRVRYDAAAAGRCLEAIRARCDLNLSVEDLCDDVFTGTIALGGQCFRHEECAGDAYCAGEASRCPGTCTARRAPGQSCDTRSQCSPGSGTSNCGTGACARLAPTANVAEGQPCGSIVEDAGVGRSASCAAGLYCRRGTGGGNATCQRPLPLDAPCRSGDACAGSAACVQGRCAAVTVQNAPGAACGNDSAMFCNPAQNLTCTGGTCATIGNGAEGSPCMGGDFYEVFSCNAGLYCDRATSRCARRRGSGEACMATRECATGACVDGRCLGRQCVLAPM